MKKTFGCKYCSKAYCEWPLRCFANWSYEVHTCCDKSETSRGTNCYHLVTKLQSYKIDGGNRLVTSCSNKTIRNKLLRTCCHQLVNKTISALPEQLVARLLGASILLQLIPDLPTTGNEQCEHALLTSCAIFARVSCRMYTFSQTFQHLNMITRPPKGISFKWSSII
jgi:hypothetical protein